MESTITQWLKAVYTSYTIIWIAVLCVCMLQASQLHYYINHATYRPTPTESYLTAPNNLCRAREVVNGACCVWKWTLRVAIQIRSTDWLNIWDVAENTHAYRRMQIKVSASVQTCWWQRVLQSPPWKRKKGERPLRERLFALSSWSQASPYWRPNNAER